MPSMILLVFLLACCLKSTYGIIQLANGTELQNVDAAYVDHPYNVTSTFTKIQFASGCKVTNPSNIPKSEIILVIWDEASSNGCFKLEPVIEQAYDIYHPEVSIVTSAFTDLDDYNLYEVYYEAFGEILYILPSNITLVTNETAYQLLALPMNTTITVTWQPSVIILYYLSTSWLAMRWIFFSFFVISFFHALAMLIIYRQFWQHLRYLSYFLITLGCLFKIIEFGVDPFFSTMKLTHAGVANMFWLAACCFIMSTQNVLFHWMKILSLNNLQLLKKVLETPIFVFILTSIPVVCVFIILVYSLQFQGFRLALVTTMGIFCLLVTLEAGLIFFAGMRTLRLLKSDLSNSQVKQTLLRKTTIVMLLLLADFVAVFIIALIYSIIQFYPLLYTGEAMLGIYISVHSAFILGNIATMYFFHTQPEKSSASSRKNERGMTQQQDTALEF